MNKRETILTKQDKYFINGFMKGLTSAEALRQALKKSGEDERKYSDNVLYNKAYTVLRKPKIMNEINKRRQVMEANANLATQRFQKIITDGKDSDAIKAGIFSIEQVDGKATQVIEQKSEGITLKIDLTSSLLRGDKSLTGTDKPDLLEG